MKSSAYRNLGIHSILIFVLSFILNTIIHEGAHAVMGKVFGLTPVLHHNYVSSNSETASHLAQIMVPAAGPVMSLIQGIIFLFFLRTREKKTLLSLFYLWLSVMGFINIGGYLFMTPIFAYGDTGKVFNLLGTPLWLQWVVAVSALIALVKIILNFTPDFENQVPAEVAGDNYVPGRLANLLILQPVLFGSIATTLLALPVPSFLSLLYPTTSPFILFMIYGRLRRKEENLIGSAHYPTLSLPLVFFTLIAIVISRLLVNGVTL
jgi:hypothetical protein